LCALGIYRIRCSLEILQELLWNIQDTTRVCMEISHSLHVPNIMYYIYNCSPCLLKSDEARVLFTFISGSEIGFRVYSVNHKTLSTLVVARLLDEFFSKHNLPNIIDHSALPTEDELGVKK